MERYLALSPADRGLYCEQAAVHFNLPKASIEKDFWVCWTLRELFRLPRSGSHLTFKGGTSLSKGWQLIQRFSEDIDIVIHRDALGFGGDKSPQQEEISGKERERRVKGLSKECKRYFREVLEPELRERLNSQLGSENWELVPDPDAPGEPTLLFHYPGAWKEGGYLRPVVKIEIGARSDIEPHAQPEIRPYLHQALPEALGAGAFAVRVVAPKRTFWEKAMLLHEERFSAEPPKERLSRHYYDLYCLIHAGVAKKAVANLDLFESVAAHRAIFFRKNKETHESLRRGSLSILPAAETASYWKDDYRAMADSMFFGTVPPFEEVLRVVGEFEHAFNTASQPRA